MRFRLKEAWPDFMTFYGTSATGAGWIVPKKYVERVGPDAFKTAPVGAGPYRLASFKPGVELVLEAFEGYWRKPPPVKRLILRSVPEEASRFAALKSGDVDIAFNLRGPLAEEAKRSPGLKLASVLLDSVFWLDLPDQCEYPMFYGVGPRVGESGVGLIRGWLYPAPFEELKLKAQ